MITATEFPVLSKWPARRPDVIQLYSYPSPNGVKVAAALEELGLPYEAHRVDIMSNETWTPEFLSLNPNGKIPAIIDPDGPGKRPLALFESGSILLYLAEKTGRLIPADPAGRYETIQWLFFQNAAVGPTFGQLGFFYRFGGRAIEDKRPLERYRAETVRLLQVIETRLDRRTWIMGDEFSVADLSMFGWVRVLVDFYDAGELVGFDRFARVQDWLKRVLARPAVGRSLQIPV